MVQVTTSVLKRLSIQGSTHILTGSELDPERRCRNSNIGYEGVLKHEGLLKSKFFIMYTLVENLLLQSLLLECKIAEPA